MAVWLLQQIGSHCVDAVLPLAVNSQPGDEGELLEGV